MLKVKLIAAAIALALVCWFGSKLVNMVDEATAQGGYSRVEARR